MTIIQMTYSTDVHEVTLVSETGETVVVPLTTDVTGTAVMTIIAGAHIMTAETITEAAPVMTGIASLLPNQSIAQVIPQNVRSKRLRSSMLCTPDDQSSL